MFHDSPVFSHAFFAPLWVLLLVTLLACPSTGGSDGPAQQLPSVTVARPTVKMLREEERYTGRVEPVESVEIRARVSGYVTSIDFEDGALAKKGDLLFEIDARPFRAALRSAQAERLRADAQAKLAGVTLERAEKLLESGAISNQAYDDSRQASRSSRAAEQSAAANVASARLDLDYSRIRAPITGRLSRTLVDQGDLAEQGTVLTTIVSQDPVRFLFTVDERAALEYTKKWGDSSRIADERVPVHLVGKDEVTHKGHIDFIDNRIDTQSGTREMRAVFPNPKGQLVAGMFAEIVVQSTEPQETTLIPDKAVVADQTLQFVWVVDDEGNVERREVELGGIADGLRVVRKGLTREDRVITDGTQNARPGVKVDATEAPPEPSA